MSVHYYSARHYHGSQEASRDETLFRSQQMVWFTLAVIESILLLRFGLKMLGANAAASFAALVYSASDLLLAPFRYILPAVRYGRSILEWGTILAMAAYSLIALAIVKAIGLSRPARVERVIEEA